MRNSWFLFCALLIAAGTVPAAGDELDSSFQSLKEAVAAKDMAKVRTLAPATSKLARDAAAVAAPANESEKEQWKEHTTYARDVATYAEYALYTIAVGVEPATQIEILNELQEMNPKSKYLDEGFVLWIAALNSTGAKSKIVPLAEKGLASFPNNEDLLAVMMEHAVAGKQVDRALTYSERLIGVLTKHGKPEGYGAADWERKKNTVLGRAYLIAGTIQHDKRRFMPADQNLRAALPLLKGSDASLASALFYLSLSDYELGRTTANKQYVLDAAKFSEQCAAIAGPLQQQAWTNASVMKKEAQRMR